jgi:phosphatidylglycerophosphatase A
MADQSINYFRLPHIISTFFWVGRLPGAPGTYGSAAALPFAYWLQQWGGSGVLLLATILVTAIGIWASGETEKALDGKDPGEVVIDEVAGMWLTVLFLPADWALYAIAFVVFRVFDVFKPWPVDHFDRIGNGGVGIMQDDLAAGLYGMMVMYAMLTFQPTLFGMMT